MYLMLLLLASIAFIIFASVKLNLHPFLALLIAAFGYGILSRTIALADVTKAVTDGYGAVVGSIGIVILAGSIIGVFLERSGGALRIAEAILRVIGVRQVPMAMGLLGYVVSIPVFCDSGFVILSPLNKALSKKAGTSLAAGAMALSLGLYATHTMVPPTPGPVAAAGILKADLGLVMLWGALVAFVGLIGGYLFSVLVASRYEVLADEEPVAKPEELAAPAASAAPAAPGLVRSLLPILIPMLLIVLNSIAQFPAHPLGEHGFARLAGFLGAPTVALLIGVGFAFLLPRRLDTKLLSVHGWVGEAVTTAASIIIITGAGGAFGRVLMNSGLPDVLTQYFDGAQLGIWLPFLLAAAIKTAQGSSTVALITTAGIVAPMLEAFGLDAPTMRALTVVAIGAGSMVVSHANDSYFWVVTQFSRMTLSQGYRLQTIGTAVEGTVSILAVWIISRLV